MDKTAENAVWSYEEPIESVPEIKDYVSFYWKMMDAWYEEDEEIFLHPRDPYKRVDVIQSSRHVRIIAGGETLAESARPRLLFETGCPTRYYFPEEDVRMALLISSEKTSICPYKGEAVYWSARAGGEVFEDVVWSYPGPISECPKIKGLLSFYNERVDEILVDGEAVEKPGDN